MSHLTDSTFRNTLPRLPNSPGHGSGPAKSVTTSHSILSPDLPICSTDGPSLASCQHQEQDEITHAGGCGPWGKAGCSRVQVALVCSGSWGAVIPGPPPAAQRASRSDKHQNTCSAMQEQPGELQEQGKQILILGTTRSSLPSATPRQGPNLGAAPEPAESGHWVQGDNMRHWCPGQAGEAVRAPMQPAHCQGRRQTLHIWEALGSQRRTGAEPAHRQAPPLPLHPIKGSPGHSKLSGTRDKGREGA